MKKVIKIFLSSVLLMMIAAPVLANELTHAIGNTGYMIQDAMWAKANQYDPQNYYQALRLQNKAKYHLRGVRGHKRNTEKAMTLTQQAYDLAKQARDNALRLRGKKVSE